MDVERDTETPETPSDNDLLQRLYQALPEFAEFFRLARTSRRAYPRKLVVIESDHVRSWIEARSGCVNTARVYYAEARRLLTWAVAIAAKPLRSLSREDLHLYRTFLLEPDPRWIGPKTPALFDDGTLNPQWRPFEKALTPAHVLQVSRILKSLFDYLIDCGYRDTNPLYILRAARLQLAPRKNQTAGSSTPAALHIEQWRAVLEAIDAIPNTARDQLNYFYERSRFLFRLFYHLGAHIGELEISTMSDFYQRDNGNWYWQVKRRGNVEHIDVNDDMLEALKRYRQHHGFEPLPTATDRSPLLLDRIGREAISGRQIFNNVKEVFSLAAEILSRSDPHLAAQLQYASPRWIRNAAALHSVQLCEKSAEELVGVQLHLRHPKLEKTLGYVRNTEKIRRAAADRLSKNIKQIS